MEIQVESVPKNPLLEEVIEDPLVTRVLGGSTEALAAATRPTFLNNLESPVTWGPTDWEAAEARRQDIFDPASIEEQLDPGKFLEEGYAVFEEVMTEAARQKWIEAVKEGQKINDALLRADWNEIDWEGLGRTRPKKRLTEEEIEKAIGGNQQAPQAPSPRAVARDHVASGQTLASSAAGRASDTDNSRSDQERERRRSGSDRLQGNQQWDDH